MTSFLLQMCHWRVLSLVGPPRWKTQHQSQSPQNIGVERLVLAWVRWRRESHTPANSVISYLDEC